MDNSEQTIRKEDRRITRTRTALRRSFRDLVKEKGYEAVTIEEITERANLGRTTFYLHYRDKEDLFLEDFENKLFAQVENVSPRPLIQWFSKGEDNIVKAVFEMVLENADLFQALTKEQSNKVYYRFRDIHVKAVSKLIQESPAFQQRIQNVNFILDFILNYYSGALWACIVWWVEQGFKPGSEEMTDSFLTMFSPGLLVVISREKKPEIVQNIAKNNTCR
ncbi:MAG: TetR/AcrR family transcriptional regulator [Chloroflexi bacterium]|nr:TetR/AcrR family transcriptional regulator [Chloroflexota bacterium]